MLEYELDQQILAKCGDKLMMHKCLGMMFKQIVVPMTKALRKIMLQFGFASEAEMFTSDLHFKMFAAEDANQSFKPRDGPSKHEDACENLRSQLTFCITRFEKIYEQLSKDNEINAAVALYLATYFDQNKSCK